MTDWVIVASALQGLGGHNFPYTEIVREAFRKHGIDPVVLVNQAVPSDFAATFRLKPAFSRGAYDFPAPGPVAGLGTWRAWSKVFEKELEQALPSTESHIFSHTLGAFELEAWSRIAPRLPPRTTLTLLFRGTPGYLRMPAWKRVLHPYFRHRPVCLRSLRSSLGSRFRAVTDSEELSADTRAVYEGTVETFPIPLDPLVLRGRREESSWASTELTLGYLGDGRPSKGFGLLPQVAQLLFPSTNRRMLLQCVPPTGADAPGLPFFRARDALKQAQAEGDAVTLVEDRLTRAGYAALVAAMDIVIIPYIAPEYRESTSGIFAEAVAVGKPVVVPSMTWMSAELERGFGAGVVYRAEEEMGLAKACVEAARRFEDLKRVAVLCAPDYARRNSAEALVATLLREGVRAGRQVGEA